ncbi:hypothetical protein LCGC14_2756690 [marine sediment metagenome]|uniref:Uncharacterized protein n=1 Tax=marine sediment metagenome TaxID=412755 RepID=A0A0F8Z0B7_9ZZZZ
MKFNKLETIGLFGFFISGIVMSWFIFSGNAHYLVQAANGQYFPVWNKFFDYSVVSTFTSLLVFAIGKIGGEEKSLVPE